MDSTRQSLAYLIDAVKYIQRGDDETAEKKLKRASEILLKSTVEDRKQKPKKKVNKSCNPVQQNDEMYCSTCNCRWDINDNFTCPK